MSLKNDIKQLWSETFGDSRDWVEMYFSRVYRDDDALTIYSPEGKLISSLLLQPYRMTFAGADTVGIAYIAGAATRRQWRGHGYMHSLLADALRQARTRGDMAVALIPATSALYFYYARLGFATVFFTDPQRFTALHQFPAQGEWRELDDHFSTALFDTFRELEMAQPGANILHSRRDFLNILDDLRADGGRFVAVERAGTPAEAGMAWGSVVDSPTERRLVVKKVLASSPEATMAVLHALRGHFPDIPVTVMAAAAHRPARALTPRGMARIVDAGQCLAAVAAAHPDLSLNIRITDRELPDNAGCYRVAEGMCRRIESPGADTRFDFDVDIATFTSIVFSAESMADILRFPCRRAEIYLMLD